MNKPVSYCITANTLDRSHEVLFFKKFFFIKYLDPSLFPQEQH